MKDFLAKYITKIPSLKVESVTANCIIFKYFNYLEIVRKRALTTATGNTIYQRDAFKDYISEAPENSGSKKQFSCRQWVTSP